jgi:hypothetical protein
VTAIDVVVTGTLFWFCGDGTPQHDPSLLSIVCVVYGDRCRSSSIGAVFQVFNISDSELGILVLCNYRTHDPKLAELMMNTFEMRYQQLLIHALSCRSGTKETDIVLRVLTVEELKGEDLNLQSVVLKTTY